MKPEAEYVQEALDQMVNETFDRCIKKACINPEQRRKLNFIATETTAFQELILNEVNDFLSRASDGFNEYIQRLDLRIEQKRSDINAQLVALDCLV